MTVSAAVPALICKVTVNVEVPALAKLALVQLMGVMPPTGRTLQVHPAGITMD